MNRPTGRPMGRPPMAEEDRKRKIHVSVDPEVFVFLQAQENASEFMNKAATILMRAYQKRASGG